MASKSSTQESDSESVSDEKIRGFDCEFVDPPPDILQIECPVCLLVIREPHQVICCGNSFCHSCIQTIKDSNKPCPTCNKVGFSDFPDKKLKRSLYDFKVYCNHKKDGCEWTGELRQLESHLNKDPQPGQELDGCGFVTIDCLYECGAQVQRQKLQSHLTERCFRRPFSCEHCHDYESTYYNVIHNHWPVCGFFPVHCPNLCGLEPSRQEVDSHLSSECPLTNVSCSFFQVGCKVKLLRKQIPNHMRESLFTHTSLLATSYAKQQAEIIEYQAEIAKQQTEIVDLQVHVASQAAEKVSLRLTMLELRCEQLRNENTLLRKELTILTQDPKIKEQSSCNTIMGLPIVTMTDFKQYEESGKTWYSSPVYTHQMGYKLCLVLDANGLGLGKGRYVSVSLSFMKGEFDGLLKWPFRGAISFRLLDRESGTDHFLREVVYDGKLEGKVGSRVTKGEMPKPCITLPKYIAHVGLKPKYLVNDCLCFQFCKVELK